MSQNELVFTMKTGLSNWIKHDSLKIFTGFRSICVLGRNQDISHKIHRSPSSKDTE